jgi:hypothetical protein
VQKFPEGVAVRIPPRSTVIGGTHMLNTGAQSLTTGLGMRIYTIGKAEVTVPLAPFRFSYLDLTIPARSRSEFWGECDYDDFYQQQLGRPLEMELYYVLPHYHALGASFSLEIFGGPNDGQSILEIGGFDSEAHGRAYDPPVSMTGAKGFRIECGFDNPRQEEVGWGIGDQEMCVMLGFTRSELGYDSWVQQGAAVGEDEGIAQFSGPCSVLGFPYSQDKPGGAP